MFPSGFSNEVQVVETVMSYDNINSPESLAIIAGATALAISDIPFGKLVAGVKIGWIDGVGPILNPNPEEMEKSRLNMILSGTENSIVMIEGYCDFLTEEELIKVYIYLI